MGLPSANHSAKPASTDRAPQPPASIEPGGPTPAPAVDPRALEQLDGEMRESAVLAMQTTQGNAFVQRLVAARDAAPLVQRQTTPAPAPGVTPPPAPGNVPPATLPTLRGPFQRAFPRFDAKYVPGAPAPAVSALVITHNVFIDFKPFDEVRKEEPYKNMKFTKAQKADFAWTKAEETKFAADFIASVHKGWSSTETKHKLHLKDPSFTEYIAAVQVNVAQVKDASKAHTNIKAMKIPKGAPRYRSFVKGKSATLDIRDPSEAEKHTVRDRQLVRQVKPFAPDSADTAPVEAQLAGLSSEMKKMVVPGADPKSPLGADWRVFFRGRSTNPGATGHNLQLGMRRAEAVKKRINELMGWTGVGTTLSMGEEHATDAEEFRRVDVAVSKTTERQVEQTVAAHEFGHMIGLDDEYEEEDAGKDGTSMFLGDESEHYEKIKQLMGEDAAKETLRQDSASIMSVGGEVKRGHYVFFLEAMNQMTGKSWSVE